MQFIESGNIKFCGFQNYRNMRYKFRGKLAVTLSFITVLCAGNNLVAQHAATAGSEQAKIKKVVIDPGHGGKHPGCVYKTYLEKDVTLGIATKLGELIKKNSPGVEVVYTRTTDQYVDLVDRGKIANKANADLFISIHINSSTNQNARGVSTHVMGMDKSNQNLEVAMKENDVIIYEDDYSTKYEGYNPGDPASYIMFSLMQYAYQDQSMMFAQIIQKHFKSDLPMPDRGTTQEPFLVLWRTSMPSVLVEVGFLSNQTDRAYVTTEKGQAEAARSLFNAFSEYKSKVEGRANVVMLKEPQSPAPQTGSKAPEKKKARVVPAVDTVSQSVVETPNTAQVEERTGDGVLFYVQLSFCGSRKSLNDAGFKSYRNKVVEKPVAGRGYRYLVGGVSDYNETIKLQSEVRKQFPDAFVVAYEGDKQLDVKVARRKLEQ